jgi:glycosyltransferase involved in cell wall biosynthesis
MTTKNDTPLVSIVTIVRNRKQAIEETMLSVFTQTYANIEYIIIDGASTDGTIDKIKKYDEEIKKGIFPNFSAINFKWLSEPDTGVYNAMNKGIRLARGKWINFLNVGDSFFDNTVVQKMLTQANAQLIYGDTMMIKNNKRCFLQRGRKNLSFLDFYIGYISHPATFFQKELFSTYGVYDEKYKIVSDWAFYIKTIVINGISTQYINYTVANYDLTGLSSSIKQKQMKERNDVLQCMIPEKILDDYKKIPISLLKLYYTFLRLGVKATVFYILRAIKNENSPYN